MSRIKWRRFSDHQVADVNLEPNRFVENLDFIPTPNFVDISPSGSRIVVGPCKEDASTPEPWNGPWAWRLDFSTRVRLGMGTNCTHSGWGAGGEEYYISQDSCGLHNEEITRTCDTLMAVDVNDPDGWENRISILHMGDHLGWGNGMHVGRVYDPTAAGFALVSTYTDSIDSTAPSCARGDGSRR